MVVQLLAVVLASGALGQSQIPKLDPNDPAAWEKALSAPAALRQGLDFTGKKSGGSHFILPLLKSGMLASPARDLEPSRSLAVSGKIGNVCAIPLTRVPIDPKIDPKMSVRPNSGTQSPDNMPQAKTIPVCRED